MIDVDTSVWVALMTREPGTAQVKVWFGSNAEPLVSADWTLDRNQSANAGRLGLTLEFPDPDGL
jgi:uncharacterized protein with PIN domain